MKIYNNLLIAGNSIILEDRINFLVIKHQSPLSTAHKQFIVKYLLDEGFISLKHFNLKLMWIQIFKVKN